MGGLDPAVALVVAAILVVAYLKPHKPEPEPIPEEGVERKC